MGIVNRDEIVGIHDENSIKCKDCMTNEDWNNLKEEDIILQNEIEGDDMYFCDECEKQL